VALVVVVCRGVKIICTGCVNKSVFGLRRYDLCTGGERRSGCQAVPTTVVVLIVSL